MAVAINVPVIFRGGKKKKEKKRKTPAPPATEDTALFISCKSIHSIKLPMSKSKKKTFSKPLLMLGSLK